MLQLLRTRAGTGPVPARRGRSNRQATVMAAMATLPLSPQKIEELAQFAMVWAAQHGLQVGAGPALMSEKWSGPPTAVAVHAPMALLPSRFPKRLFSQAVRLAPLFNALVDAVSRDASYLRTTLQPVLAHDDFTARLLQVHDDALEASAKWGRPQIVLGIHRSDYMVDAPTGRLLQVEINTVASSFGSLSSLTAEMHRAVLDRAGMLDTYIAGGELPENGALKGIVAGIAAAWRAYGSTGAVLMVVQANERNLYDQQWVASQLWSEHRIPTIRSTLGQIEATGRLAPDGTLLLAERPIAVAYFRAGYTPNDYLGQAEWNARLLIERSACAKCPSAAYHLAGAKKVQQQLATPAALDRFLPAASADTVRKCFAGLWSLDPEDPAAAAAARDAAARPEGYVLKPQREGGGNNFYRDALQAKLLSGEDLSAYILMERIHPPVGRAYLMREGHVAEADVLSELGIYSVYLRSGQSVLQDAAVGHLLRTKTQDSDEGGVAAGFAVLDSPWLVECSSNEDF